MDKRDVEELLLIRVVRDNKGGIKAKLYHFTAHKTDAVLFRFKRKEGEAR